MNISTSNLSLSRRLVGSYLAFVLAGLFACLVATMALALRGELLDLSGAVLIVPAIFVVVGAWALQRLVRTHGSIEAQLQRLASAEGDFTAALAPLPDSAPLCQGWNALVEQVQRNIVDVSLDAKLGAYAAAMQQQGWESIAQNLPDGIIASDPAGLVLRANRSALAFLGVTAEADVLGKEFVALLATRITAAPQTTWDGLRQGTSSLVREIELGKEIAAGVWRVTRSPLLHEMGPTSGNVWTLRDITQQRLAEDARQQFVATATHELRTPLANIKAYAETLATATRVDPEQQQSFYNIINAEATRLARFVDDLLNVSQMETGAIAVTRTDVDLERLVAEVTEHVTPQSQQKQQRFEAKLPQKYPKVRADKDKLSAALVNLIGNAIKYTPEGGWVQLKVEADAAQLRFIVEDNGIGIAADELPQLCQKFFRSSDARVRDVNGSGLGLAFTQEVAKLHGGAVAVVSELNKGSQFTLSLPLA